MFNICTNRHKNNELDQKKSKIDPASIAINLDLKHNVEELLRGEGTPPREGMTPLSGPRTGATSALDPPHPSDSDAEKADLLANVLASALAEEGEAEVKPKKKKLTKAEKLMGFTEDGPPPAMDRPPANTSETTSRLFGLFGKNSSESRKLGVPSGSKKSNPTKGGKGRNFGLKSIADDDEASFHSMDSKASKGSRRTGKKKRGNGSDAEARMQSLAYGGARADSTTNLSTGALSGKDADLRRLEAELGNETDNLAILIDNKVLQLPLLSLLLVICVFAFVIEIVLTLWKLLCCGCCCDGCAQNKIKKELKDWETNFQRRVGRPPNDADKTAIEERFLAYRTVSVPLLLLSTLLVVVEVVLLSLPPPRLLLLQLLLLLLLLR